MPSPALGPQGPDITDCSHGLLILWLLAGFGHRGAQAGWWREGAQCVGRLFLDPPSQVTGVQLQLQEGLPVPAACLAAWRIVSLPL